jgi:hypothetical protein
MPLMNIKSALECWSLYEENMHKTKKNKVVHSSVWYVNNVTYMMRGALTLEKGGKRDLGCPCLMNAFIKVIKEALIALLNGWYL